MDHWWVYSVVLRKMHLPELGNGVALTAGGGSQKKSLRRRDVGKRGCLEESKGYPSRRAPVESHIAERDEFR